jgi:hypothetical protein
MWYGAAQRSAEIRQRASSSRHRATLGRYRLLTHRPSTRPDTGEAGSQILHREAAKKG